MDSLARDMSRYDKAEQKKQKVMGLIQEAMSFGVPNRDVIYQRTEQGASTTEGQKNQNEAQVFDSTTAVAVGNFVSNLQSSLVPPMKRWIKLKSGVAIAPKDRAGADKSLEDVTESLFSNLQNSNFDTQIAESFYDLAAGTGALMVRSGTRANPFKFTAVAMDELVIEEEEDGKIGLSGRRHKVLVRLIKELWDDAMIPPEITRLLVENPEAEIVVREITLPEKVKILQQSPNGRMEYVTVDGFRYTVIAEQGRVRLVERQQRSSPWVIFRWSVVPGETWGRGPIMTALADIKTLNKTKELTLKSATMAIVGAYTVVDDGVVNVNTMRIYPGAKIPVASNGDGGMGGPSIKRLDAAGNFDISSIIIKDLQRAINEVMYANPLGPIDLPVKSATEVSLRQQELAKRIGSAFGRLQFELIAPLINRLLHIMEEMGLVDLQSYRVDGQVIAIQHISPLAMQQDEEELVSIMRYSQVMVQTYGPQIAALIMDPQVFGETVGTLLNVPQKLLPSPEQWASIKQNIMSFAKQVQPSAGTQPMAA